MLQQVQEKHEESQLYKIRHSLAHIMAQAVLEMFPNGKTYNWSTCGKRLLL
jgi:threonyl-tRNA synthetase